ncbi:MAG: hypothetical protein RMX96_11225 [Nostoc sp. ChiSLP02]|nr:hypothetical protein [Nostoc sp. DedSLP05]MDZ8099172.1 hypothetical protein [Nostoc sp. DedSLP01]MDZ8185411.1 hypothetical protein [Nostoc sp. ChiSLP02]
MEVKYNELKKWILRPMMMGLLVAGTIASKAEINFSLANPAMAAQVVSLEKSTPQPARKEHGIYQSDRFRFQFSYSLQDFVIDNKITTPNNNVNSPLATVDIWTHKHAQKIRAGEYEGGTEYPANVRVSVYKNPARLNLQKWVKQSNDFSLPREFKTAKIAGQSGFKFKSSGLYENEHVAFISPKDSRIIVVTISKTGYGNNDAIYERAYQQVVNSFTFLNR